MRKYLPSEENVQVYLAFLRDMRKRELRTIKQMGNQIMPITHAFVKDVRSTVSRVVVSKETVQRHYMRYTYYCHDRATRDKVYEALQTFVPSKALNLYETTINIPVPNNTVPMMDAWNCMVKIRYFLNMDVWLGK